MKKFVYLFVLSLIFSSCQKSIEEDLYEKINNQLSYNNQKINLSNHINFDWDTAFVFKSYVSFDKVNKTVGAEVEDTYKEGTRIIFKKGKNIVFYEYHEVEWDSYEFHEIYDLDKKVIFDIPDSAEYLKFYKNDAYFLAHKEKASDNSEYLLLSHVNSSAIY